MKAIYMIGMIVLLSAMMIAPASATTWYVDDDGGYDFTTIQGALSAASDGDTVFVYNGTYCVDGFSLNVPNLTVRGEGADVVTYFAPGLSTNIRIGDLHPSPGCIVEGFTVENSEYGIVIYPSAPNCIIRNCIFDGMTVNPNFKGDNVTIENCTFKNFPNAYAALYMESVDGKSCNIINNTVTNCNGAALLLWETTNSIVKGNNFSSNGEGIELYAAGSGNRIYLNDIVDNGVTATTSGTTPPDVTYWNSTEPIEYTYGGTTYTNYLGNYWGAAYGGIDGDGDGIGDTPYTVPDGLGNDFRPLMQPFENYPVSEPAPPDSLEFGDAPDPTYPSLLASNGARHTPTDTECLGLAINGSDWKDFEPDANVPDLDFFDDGLLTTVLTAGNPTQTVSFEVTNMIAQNDLLVNILLDLNQNGIWDSGEHVVQNQPINLFGPADDTFTSLPFSTVGATGGPTWMRITLTRQPINPGWDGTMASAGYAEQPFECGETEDWLVELQEIVPPTPFSISGEVDYNNGDPVPDPAVTVLNTNTSEPFAVNISGNAYQVTTDSTHVGAGDVLHFNASKDNVTEFNRTVISEEMDTGGFVQDITIVQPVVPLPDLIVESVSINPGCKHYYFANEPNVLEVTVKNIGITAAGPSSASVSGASGTSVAAVSALNSGESQTVTITDPVARPAGEVVTATADCYGEVTESDETNNASSIIDPDGNDHVINHGLKGKWLAEGYAGPDPGNMTTWKSYELHGDLNYSVGDSYYISGYTPWEHYTASWTADDLPISSGATVVEARLYVYYTWDKAQVMPDNVSMSFNGVNQDPYDVHYTDRRGYGSMSSYNLPYGALVYNVTDDFDTTGNHANVTKLIASSNQASMRGMMLVAVYEDPTEPLRQIFVIEEYDTLYGAASYCTTPDEATARALFTGPSIDMGTMVNANLVTVASGASPNEGDLIFNGQVWTNVWNFAGTTELGIDERDVKDNLTATDNAVGFQSSGDWMEASNAFLVVEYKAPDLIVSAIKPNCGGYLFGNESNKICAAIENIGDADAGAFNVNFVVDGSSEEAQISGLAAGTSTEVCITDTTLRSAGDIVTITITADCNAEVDESDETNNTLALDMTVVNNGYKGKRYTGGDDITTLATYDLNGNLVYSVGDSYYLSSYSDPDWTNYDVSWAASDLPVPRGATIKEARLYMPYTWDKEGVMPTYASLSFNGAAQTLDAHYSDEKGWATSYPYGMLVYDVTADFDARGNVANLINSVPGGGGTSMRGMLLTVIYEDAGEPRRLIYVGEEFDLLYGGLGKCTTPEEATAYAPITGPAIDTATALKTRLITVAPGAGPTEGELLFNGEVWTNVWNFAGATQLGIDERDVTQYLESTGNLVGFQSSGDYMEACNVFLVVESAGVTFDKKRLDLNSSGILKAYITLPEDYDVADIDVATVECEGAHVFGDSSVIPGKQALEVKFKIPDLVGVPTGDAVLLTVTGELYDGTPFEGSNTLEVV